MIFLAMGLLGTKKGTRGSLFSSRSVLLKALDAFVAALSADRQFFAAFATA